MSYIRMGQERIFFDAPPMYVYSSVNNGLQGLPTSEEAFGEVAMRMLEQSDELSEDELRQAQAAFAKRMRLDPEDCVTGWECCNECGRVNCLCDLEVETDA